MTQTEAPPEAIEAALALAQAIAEDRASAGISYRSEARRIAAMLPKPVDPAVLACRQICTEHWTNVASQMFFSGELDDTAPMESALAAYRAGREAKHG